MDSKLITQELLRCLEQNKPAALVTIVSTTGSTPARPGAKMIIYADGSITGTIGGGRLEAAVIEEARKVIQEGEPRYTHYSLNQDEAASLGMACGGTVNVFIDPIMASPEMVIIGAGHISQYLAQIVKMLDFNVTVIDDRKDFANQEKFPGADNIIAGNIATVLADYKISENTYLVILTRGHQDDQAALEKVACSKAAYIGMIGSKNKVKTVFDNLKQNGFPSSSLERVHAPIGLNLGGNTPAEIALSIAAEIIKVRYQKGDQN
ncbi:MAG: XdhC/CoxI family protein [Bacillota bacterium]